MEIVEEKVVHDVQQLATAVAKDGGGGGRWVSQENWRPLNYPPEALAIMGVQPERNPVPASFPFWEIGRVTSKLSLGSVVCHHGRH